MNMSLPMPGANIYLPKITVPNVTLPSPVNVLRTGVRAGSVLLAPVVDMWNQTEDHKQAAKDFTQNNGYRQGELPPHLRQSQQKPKPLATTIKTPAPPQLGGIDMTQVKRPLHTGHKPSDRFNNKPLGGIDMTPVKKPNHTGHAPPEKIGTYVFQAKAPIDTSRLNLPVDKDGKTIELKNKHLAALAELSQPGKINRNIPFKDLVGAVIEMGGELTPTKKGGDVKFRNETMSYHTVHGTNDKVGPHIGMKEMLERAGIIIK
jgi:hypothetical protein